MERLALERIFTGLADARVDYLVVGGLAVVAHGYVRFTADVDLFIQLEKTNLIKAMTVFQDLGYIPRAPVDIMDFVEPEARAKWLDTKNLKVFSLWNPQVPSTEIDVFVEEPFDFEMVKKRAVAFDFGYNIHVPVIGLPDLILMKKTANRPKDRDDIKQLGIINENLEK